MSGPLLAARTVGVLAMGLYAVAVVGTATDRMAETRALWEAVVPTVVSDHAWRSRAAIALQRNDAVAALAADRAAVESGPVEPASSELLGRAYLLAGRADAADRAFRVAGQLGWRRPLTQAYWIKRALAGGNFADAARRLDAVLRQSPEDTGNPATMRPFEDSPEGRRVLLGKLAGRPPWLLDYARTAAALDIPELRNRAAILTRLPTLGVSLGCEAIGGAVSRLVENGEAIMADALWRGHCPAEAGGFAGDGTFARTDLSRRASLLSWFAPADSDVGASLVDDGVPGQPRLRIVTTSPFVREVVNRMIVLPPGRYRLQWQSVTTGGEASDRIVAVLGCRQGTGEPLAASVDTRNGVFSAQVDQGGDCLARWLSFAVKPGPAALRFGNVRIDRAE